MIKKEIHPIRRKRNQKNRRAKKNSKYLHQSPIQLKMSASNNVLNLKIPTSKSVFKWLI